MNSGDMKRMAIFWAAILLAAPTVFAQEPNDVYPLDDASREVSPRGTLQCPEVPIVSYRGSRIRYTLPARVHPAFITRLERFEQVVAETAVSVFGREPTAIVQKGSYNCRRVRTIPSLLSEHSLGNAVDVYGFTFGPLEKGQTLPEGLPKNLKRSFTVSLLKHWNAKSASGRLYATFLRRLAENLAARSDIFTVLLGPAYPGHQNHFHFDRANYSLISI